MSVLTLTKSIQLEQTENYIRPILFLNLRFIVYTNLIDLSFFLKYSIQTFIKRGKTLIFLLKFAIIKKINLLTLLFLLRIKKCVYEILYCVFIVF